MWLYVLYLNASHFYKIVFLYSSVSPSPSRTKPGLALSPGLGLSSGLSFLLDLSSFLNYPFSKIILSLGLVLSPGLLFLSVPPAIGSSSLRVQGVKKISIKFN